MREQRFYQCWNEFKYGRYGVKKSEKKLKLQTGDVIRISRGSEPARLYADILEKMDIVELMIAGSEMNPSKKTRLTLKNNFSPELRRKIIAGYIKKKMNEKYTWTMLMREFGYAAGKKTLNNPLEFFNNAVEVAKTIPADFWEAMTDGTVASKFAGDGLSLLIESTSKKASLIVDSALFVSQSVNIYARSTASEFAYKRPYLIIITGFRSSSTNSNQSIKKKNNLYFSVSSNDSTGTEFKNTSQIRYCSFHSIGQWTYNPTVGYHSPSGHPNYPKATDNYALPGFPEGSLIVKRSNGQYEYIGINKIIKLRPNEKIGIADSRYVLLRDRYITKFKVVNQ